MMGVGAGANESMFESGSCDGSFSLELVICFADTWTSLSKGVPGKKTVDGDESGRAGSVDRAV